jgi:hypothetical protein
MAGGSIAFNKVQDTEQHIEFLRDGATAYIFANANAIGLYDTQYAAIWTWMYGGDFLIRGAKAWTAGNDGAGSGLDADLLDGRQASDFALLSGARFQGNGNGVAGSEDWIIFSLRNNQGSASAVGNTSWESVNENGITVTSIQSFVDPDGKSTIALVTTPPGSRTADRRQNAAYIRGRAAPPTFTAAGCSSTAIPSGGRTTTARAPGSMPICSMGSRAAGTRTSSGVWDMLQPTGLATRSPVLSAFKM